MIYFGMKNTIIFYETLSGKCPVIEFLNGLSVKHHAKVIRNLQLLEEFGQHLQGGFISHIHGDIWELRIGFGNNISRILFFSSTRNSFVLLHGFIKKTYQTPQRDIKIAQNRMKDYMRRIGIHENTKRTHKRTAKKS